MKKLMSPCPLLLLAACTDPAAAPEATLRAMSAPSRYVEARLPSSRALLEAPARLVGLSPGTVALSVLHRGRILRMHVTPGDRVEKGAPIAELAVPELAEAAARKSGLRTRLRTLQNRIDELETLKSEGLARAQPLFELRARAQQLASELGVVAAVLAGYELGARDVARLARSGRLLLRSPEAGLVLERADALGRAIEANGPPVAVIAGLRKVRVEVSLHAPLPAEQALVFRGQDGSELPLRPQPVASIRDASSGRVISWYEPESKEVLLPDGLSGSVEPKLPVSAVEVPSRALRAGEHGAEIAVLRDGDPQWTPVRVLLDSGTSAVVLGGVRGGDKVASDAAEVGR